jgi:hypothetical protein
MSTITLQHLVARLADLTGPWQSLYSDSKAVSASVAFAHVGGLLVGGGMAIAADRQTWRAARGTAEDQRRQLGELDQLHTIVLASLAVVALSGVAMFLADVEEFSTSITFWTKLALIALLLANGAMMTGTERRLRAAPVAGATDDEAAVGWRRLTKHAIASMALWIAITFAGVLLQGG